MPLAPLFKSGQFHPKRIGVSDIGSIAVHIFPFVVIDRSRKDDAVGAKGFIIAAEHLLQRHDQFFVSQQLFPGFGNRFYPAAGYFGNGGSLTPKYATKTKKVDKVTTTSSFSYDTIKFSPIIMSFN